MAQKKKSNRKRNYAIQLSYYFATHDSDQKRISDLSEQEWRNQITANLDAIVQDDATKTPKRMGLVFHDKDVKDDGTPKGLHAHIVVELADAKTPKAVMDMFGASREENCQPINHLASAWRYMTHISETAINARKHVYSADSVKCWGCDYQDCCVMSKKEKQALHGTKVDTAKMRELAESIIDSDADSDFQFYAQMLGLDKGSKLIQELGKIDFSTDLVRSQYTKTPVPSMLEQMIAHDVSVLDNQIIDGQLLPLQCRAKLNQTYGDILGSQIWNASKNQFEHDLDTRLKIQSQKLLESDRNLRSVYISGFGGSGKSTMAKALAMRWSTFDGLYHVAAAPGKDKTYDPVGNYSGENVSIFNDFDSNAMEPREFRNVFDENNYAPVNSRNTDKDWIPNVAIITNSLDINEFIKHNLLYSKGGGRFNSDSPEYNSFEHQSAIWEDKRRIRYWIDVNPNRNKTHESEYTIYIRDDNAKVQDYVQYRKFTCDDVSDFKQVQFVADEIVNCLKPDSVSKFFDLVHSQVEMH